MSKQFIDYCDDFKIRLWGDGTLLLLFREGGNDWSAIKPTKETIQVLANPDLVAKTMQEWLRRWG